MKDEKQCTNCKATKKLTEFHKSKATIDGLAYHCKVCRAKYRAENAEYINAQLRRHYHATKGKVRYKNYIRDYYKCNDKVLLQIYDKLEDKKQVKPTEEEADYLLQALGKLSELPQYNQYTDVIDYLRDRCWNYM